MQEYKKVVQLLPFNVLFQFRRSQIASPDFSRNCFGKVLPKFNFPGLLVGCRRAFNVLFEFPAQRFGGSYPLFSTIKALTIIPGFYWEIPQQLPPVLRDVR
jgi:hypothetical protein